MILRASIHYVLHIWTALRKYTFWFGLSCIETSIILSESPVKLWVLNWMFRLQCFLWKPNKLYGFNRDGEYKLFFFFLPSTWWNLVNPYQVLVKRPVGYESVCDTTQFNSSLCLYVCARIILLSFGICKKPFKWTNFYGQGFVHFVASESEICYRIFCP